VAVNTFVYSALFFAGAKLLAKVESRTGAVADAEAPPRFPSPLIKPDVPISGIRLSEWLHP